MAEIGRSLLVAGLVVAAIGALAGLLGATRPGWHRTATLALRSSAVALVGSTAVLARAFVIGDYSLLAVADHSREALGGYDRMMGLWGGMAGSLLLFTAATAAFAAVGLGRRPHPAAIAVSATVVASLAGTTLWLAGPFDTLQIPALDGAGLTPILEHWAMRIHPPLVYAGLTVLVVPTAGTVAALVDGRAAADWWPCVRGWLLASWGLLGCGMILGAHWAYAELGWGGYWAWDPVENAALLPWLAITLALHGGARGRTGRVATMVFLPFVLALLGSTLTRSGATTSVHAFAEAQSIGRALAVLLVAALVGVVVLVLRTRRLVTDRDDRLAGPARLASVAVLLAVLFVVLAGTLYPLVRAWAGGDRLAVEGHFYSGTLAPVVLLGLVALVGRGGAVPVWSVVVAAAAVAGLLYAAGWRDVFPVVLAASAAPALVVSLARLLQDRRASEVAHIGLAILLMGIAGTATGERTVVPVAAGSGFTVDGHRVRLIEVRTEPGPTSSSTAVVAELSIDGHRRQAALLAFPDRGVLLAESTLRSTPAADVQVILRDASDDGALLIVHVAPLQQLVWWGALVMIAGGILAGRRAPNRHSSASSLRRERLASRSEPRVEGGAGSRPGVRGGASVVDGSGVDALPAGDPD